MDLMFYLAGIFKPLLPFAFANNVRLVLLDARDNGQSTLYTEAELKAIYSRDKAIETEFLRSGVIEFATFLAWFIEHEDVPAIKEDIESGEKTGGINLVSWSSGSNWFIPFFAMADTIPEDIRKALDAYLGGYILFDAPFCTVGLPNPPLDKVYSCMRDPALTQEERFAMFPATVSGYYSKHAPIVRAALIATSLDTLPPVSEFWDGIQKRHDTEPDAKSPTIFRIPKDTLSRIASHEPFIRSTVQIIMGFHSEIYAECIEKVVNDVQLATCFPKARIYVMRRTTAVPDPPVDKVYSVLRDPSLPEEQRVAGFPAWIGGYYSVDAPIVRVAFSATSLATFPPASEFWDSIKKHCDAAPQAMSPGTRPVPKDIFDKITSQEVFVWSTLPMEVGFYRDIFGDALDRIVNDEKLATCFLKAKIHVRQASGQKGREIDVTIFDGASHMAHWDEPERSIEFFASIV
ncbi:hypothetical protein EUX98_g2263 [Antrodiella citrinella]|uniref:AB hydrolase-1 domain-containing protein n=1 Tax=Antrodiella citrinella TaxID=2447956 RepID=A0A4S4N7M3_9APHY|nr:hypothetical protein EUX98_g2263 [Antrodiella citrinella]